MADELEKLVAATQAANEPEPAESEPELEPAEESAAESAETPEAAEPEPDALDEGDGEEASEPEAEPEAKKKNRSKPISERLKEKTAETYQLRQELEALKAAQAASKPEPKAEAPAKPTPANFEFGDADPAYQEALADWKIEQRLAERDTEQAKAAEQQQHQQAVEAEFQQALQRVETEGATKYADFADKIAESVEARGGEPLPPLLSIAVAVSPVGTDLAYRLATDDAATARLERLAKGSNRTALALALGELEGEYHDGSDDDLDLSDQLGMARAMGRMRAKLNAATRPANGSGNGAAPKISPTNAPVPPAVRVRGGAATTKVDPGTEDTAAFYHSYAKELGLS